MTRWIAIAGIAAVAMISVFWFTRQVARAPVGSGNTTINADVQDMNAIVPSPPLIVNTSPVQAPAVVVPIADFFSRITKKPFGIYITPKTSPVQPEKFTGYHTGADAETTPAEQSLDVPIVAVANGTVVFAGHVNGYGGVVMIEHKIGAEKVTALYGHLRLSSITVKVGAKVHPNDQLAVLGTGYTSETDGERKHLHLGILRGYAINYRGYVPSSSQLSAWVDPMAWLRAHGAD